MNKKRDLRFVILFVVIVSCCLIYLFQSSYAKYRRGVSGRVSSEIASWNIKVNGEDIMDKKELTTTIEPTFLESENSNEGVIAPGVEGYYLVTIDASEVDVNFLCTIYSTVAETSSISDLKTLSYEINPTDDTSNKLEYSPDTGIVVEIPKNTSEYVFKIYLTWDDDTGTMDNQADTSVALDDTSQALMTVDLQFSQLNN
jgi:hypothetical protein